MQNRIDVICLGAAVVDIPLRPIKKNLLQIESYPVDRIAMTIGGDAFNEATIITRLGYKTALMSRVGDDPAGRFILESCKKEGIDAHSIRVDQDIDTSINIGLVTEDGERTFITNRNGSLWRTDLSDADFSRFPQARLLSLASIFNCPRLDNDALVEIFREAQKNELIVCADFIMPRLDETIEDVGEALGYVDYLFPNYDEACLLTEKKDLNEIANCFLEYGVKHVIVKTGKEGCFIKQAGKSVQIPAVQGIQAIDTIGAGGNFAAGFITALLDGKSLEECGQYANAAAAVSVQSAGATSGVTGRMQVDERLKNYA